jgi:hypothetical protein
MFLLLFHGIFWTHSVVAQHLDLLPLECIYCTGTGLFYQLQMLIVAEELCFLVLWIQNQLLLKEIEDLRRKVKYIHIIYIHFLKQTPREQHDGSYEDHILCCE